MLLGPSLSIECPNASSRSPLGPTQVTVPLPATELSPRTMMTETESPGFHAWGALLASSSSAGVAAARAAAHRHQPERVGQHRGGPGHEARHRQRHGEGREPLGGIGARRACAAPAGDRCAVPASRRPSRARPSRGLLTGVGQHVGPIRQRADVEHVRDRREPAERILVESPAVGQRADQLALDEDRAAAHATDDAAVQQARVVRLEQHCVLPGQVVGDVSMISISKLSVLVPENTVTAWPRMPGLISETGMDVAARRRRRCARLPRAPGGLATARAHAIAPNITAGTSSAPIVCRSARAMAGQGLLHGPDDVVAGVRSSRPCGTGRG